MTKIRLTKKLKAAISILADEGMADSSDKAFITALQKGKLKPNELYKALAVMRYNWNAARGYWSWRPRQLKSVKRIISIVRKIDDMFFVEGAF